MLISNTLDYYLLVVPTKQYGQLINISPKSLVVLKTRNTEFFRNRSMVYGSKQ